MVSVVTGMTRALMLSGTTRVGVHWYDTCVGVHWYDTCVGVHRYATCGSVNKYDTCVGVHWYVTCDSVNWYDTYVDVHWYATCAGVNWYETCVFSLKSLGITSIIISYWTGTNAYFAQAVTFQYGYLAGAPYFIARTSPSSGRFRYACFGAVIFLQPLLNRLFHIPISFI
jgi:hypothetical protein